MTTETKYETFFPVVKPKRYYQDISYKSLTPEEFAIFTKCQKVMKGIYIDQADYEYCNANNLNVSRIMFFLLKEWLQKKRREWGEIP